MANVAQDVFKCLANARTKKLSPDMFTGEKERLGLSDDEKGAVLPWALDKKDVNDVERFIDGMTSGSKQRSHGASRQSPFFSSESKGAPLCQRDRKMVCWTLTTKCPLAKLHLHLGLHQSANERCVTALFKLFDVLGLCLQHAFKRDELDDLQRKLNSALNTLEEVLPKFVSTVCMHSIRHVPDQIRRCGPLHQSWTMFVERYVRWVLCVMNVKLAFHTRSHCSGSFEAG